MTDESNDPQSTAALSLDRFAFGANWRSFLDTLDKERIDQAVRSMAELLCESNQSPDSFSLAGTRMLDMGSGSGLFSLAAHCLSADVMSIDYDDDSVACTRFLQQQFGSGDSCWDVRQGSALDETLGDELGAFDLVYSWGVLHHTGDMWRAIDLTSRLVSDQGRFVVSIYNDQGSGSRRWLAIKRIYNRLPRFLRPAWVVLVAGVYELVFAAARLKNGRNPLPFSDWNAKKADRGMSAWHDWVDWVGGLPFQVATPDAIVGFLRDRGFDAVKVRAVGKGWGCNEFLFRRSRREDPR